MKKYILGIIVILGVAVPIFPGGKLVKEDLYVGKTFDQVISLLGDPVSDNDRAIDENYIGYEYEPDYSRYFALDELRENVIIRILKWEKRRDIILVWGKRTSNGWVVFSSLTYRKYDVCF